MRKIIITLAAALFLSANAFGEPTTMPTIHKEAGRTTIDGVPTLAWGKTGETTFCGALSAALKPMGMDRDYPTLMGDSALAFRLRWWKPDQGQGWCPSSPVGEFSPWDNLATLSAGYQITYEVHLNRKQEIAKFAPQIKSSIDAGRPVLGYAEKMDMGVIYGYEQDGKTVLFRDYYAGDKELVIPLEKTSGLLGFLKPVGHEPESQRDRAKVAIKMAVADWSAPRAGFISNGRPGAYILGDGAYARWIDDLKQADTLAPESLKQLFMVNWWVFNVLADARWSAVGYLHKSAELFDGETSAAMHRAADHYASSAKTLSAAFQKKDGFFGPWSGKKIEDWSADVRKREIELLEAARVSDNQAIEQLIIVQGKLP